VRARLKTSDARIHFTARALLFVLPGLFKVAQHARKALLIAILSAIAAMARYGLRAGTI
jgi:hypothetical protein